MLDPAISLQNVCFNYKNNLRFEERHLYESFSFDIDCGSVLGIMGASGSGKTTLAKLIAGIVPFNKGTIWKSSQFINPWDIIYIDQNPLNSVFPWQTVKKNVAYPLIKLKWDNNHISSRVNLIMTLFQISHLANTLPARLSGGELQRVALARCFSWKPKLVVLDEAFAALDTPTKQEIHQSLHKLVSQDRTTLVLVTHNISDILSLCTRCLVIGNYPVEILTNIELKQSSPQQPQESNIKDIQKQLLNLVKDGII